MWLWYSDSDRVGKRQYGGLPKRCVYLRNTAGGGELPILQWINIDEVSLQTIIEYSSFELWKYEWKQEKLLQHELELPYV